MRLSCSPWIGLSHSRRLSLPSARVWLETAPVLSAALLCPSAALITAKTPKINTYYCPVLLPCPALPSPRHLPTTSPTLATRQFHRPRSAALRLSDLPRDASRVATQYPAPSTLYRTPTRRLLRATAPRTASSPRSSHHGPDSCAQIAQSYQPAGERLCFQSSGLYSR